MKQRKLEIRQMSNKIEGLRQFKRQSSGVESWIYYIRTALGMSIEQLAKKAKLAKPTVYQLERSEKTRNINIKSLDSLAEAMDCELVYAFIPKQKIEKTIEQQAAKKSKEILKESQLQMEYEDQKVTAKESRAQQEEMTEKIKFSKILWDD